MLLELLLKNKYHISFAESCTGGLCAARLVNVSNASSVLNESLVTYASSAKIKYLGVNKETIDKYNVVSEEVAKEMAIGLNKLTNSEVSLSITGLTGPTGDGIIPIGTVCFGFYINGKVYTRTKEFGNVGRNKVRKLACNYLYSEAIKLLK